MQLLIAACLELRCRLANLVAASDLELDADLRDRPIRRPLVGAKAGLRRLRQRPDTEVLAALDLAAVDVVTFPIQWQAEFLDEQLAAARRVGGDQGDARYELDLHGALLRLFGEPTRACAGVLVRNGRLALGRG